MRTVTCNFYGSNWYEECRIDYLYSHQRKYLLVSKTPVEICRNCSMVYYDAAVLKKIEHHFFAIHQYAEEPDCYIKVPTGLVTPSRDTPHWGRAAEVPPVDE